MVALLWMGFWVEGARIAAVPHWNIAVRLALLHLDLAAILGFAIAVLGLCGG